MSTTIKVLGKEYRVRGEIDPAHLERVSRHLDDVLTQVLRSTPDTHEAVILAALNVTSELLVMKEGGGLPRERLQALIELVESV